MGRIVVSENVSLDGVGQDPTGEEGFKHGGWFLQAGDEDREAWAKVACEEALGAEALLLGRRSYEFFAARWPSRSGGWADRLNGLPKYVVSSTLVDPEWNNSTVLNGEVVDEVSTLKQEIDGEIVIYASSQLVRGLMQHDLVDELRLMIFPVVLGAGGRLFGETSDTKPMRLVDTRTVGDGIAFLAYEPVRDDSMVDSARLGAVVDEGAAGAAELVVEGDRGGEADEASQDVFAQAGKGAGAVAFEGEQVLAGPEDALDALADRREVRCENLSAGDRRADGQDLPERPPLREPQREGAAA